MISSVGDTLALLQARFICLKVKRVVSLLN